MEKLSYQTWAVDMLEHILKTKDQYRGELRDQGYIYVIKAIIDHYSSMYYYEDGSVGLNKKKSHLNFWWDHLNRNNCQRVFSNIVMSKDAKAEVEACIRSKGDPKELKYTLHFEHMTPKGYTFEKLIGLTGDEITKDNIRKAFSYSTVILLTKDESALFDGAGCNYATEHHNSFKAHGFSAENISEAEKMIGERLKDHGTGLLRACYLLDKGVQFCTLQSDQLDIVDFFSTLNQDFELI